MDTTRYELGRSRNGGMCALSAHRSRASSICNDRNYGVRSWAEAGDTILARKARSGVGRSGNAGACEPPHAQELPCDGPAVRGNGVIQRDAVAWLGSRHAAQGVGQPYEHLAKGEPTEHQWLTLGDLL